MHADVSSPVYSSGLGVSDVGDVVNMSCSVAKCQISGVTEKGDCIGVKKSAYPEIRVSMFQLRHQRSLRIECGHGQGQNVPSHPN